jgi:MFS family permease
VSIIPESRRTADGRAARSPRVHYAWVVLGTTFVALAVGMGARSTWGIFVKPLEAEFGVTRAATSAVASVSLLLFAFSQPVIGWLLDRYGGRLVIGGSLLLIGVGCLASALAARFWQLFILFGVVGGVGAGGAGLTSGSILAIRWFTARRGLAIGLASSGFSAGQVVFYPLITLLLLRYGWRQSYVIQGAAVCLLVVPVVFWLLRNEPADKGLAPYGGTPAAGGTAIQAVPPQRSVEMSEVVRSIDFWWLALGYFVCGYTSAGLAQTHLIPYWVEHGFHLEQAARAMMLVGAMNVAGTILSGRLCDRFGNRVPLSSYYFIRGLAILFLLTVRDALSVTIFAVIFGLSYIATVPPTTGLTADLFGKASMGRVYGWITCSHQIGGALGAYLSGLLYTQTGNYVGAFTAAAALCFVASAMSYAIREGTRPPVPAPAAS